MRKCVGLNNSNILQKPVSGNIILYHILFWVVYGLMIVWLSTVSEWYQGFGIIFINGIVDVITVYLLLFLLCYRRYYAKAKARFYLVFLLLVVTAFGIKLYLPVVLTNYELSGRWFLPEGFSAAFIISFLFYVIAVILEILRQTTEKKKMLTEKIDECKQKELDFLKTQLNPQLLFNVLNDIHALTDVDAAKAKKMLKDFTHIVRYQIKQKPGELVLLENEIDFIRNFMDVCVSVSENASFTFNVNGKPGVKKIYPFIFTPLVENAYRYGISHKKGGNVEINLDILEKSITFELENEKINRTNAKNTAGIGLRNMRRRLDLLYDDDYNLIINETEDKFRIKLVLTIK
ncbi:MAG: sensor histidine kinase [Bacteroidota bacterium]